MVKKDIVLKNLYVNDLKAGDELLDELLLLKDMVRRTTKDGRPYILCTLGDKSGQISGVFWDVPASIDQWIEAGKVLYITGRINKFKDSLQVNISDAYPHQEPNLSEFLPSSLRPIEEMVAELKQMVEDLNTPYKQLLTRLLLQEPFLSKFANSPAAKSMHHAYVGGLIEHSLSMAKIAQQLANHYPQVDVDLLVAGALTHDMGKVLEYSFMGAFDLSEDGRLVGHIARAAIMVEKAAAEIGGIPEDAVRELLHLILSHHGTMEWGSPVLPKTLEAILLHQIDLLDSRVQGYFDYLNADNTEGDWTTKTSPMHNSRLRHIKNENDD